MAQVMVLGTLSQALLETFNPKYVDDGVQHAILLEIAVGCVIYGKQLLSDSPMGMNICLLMNL